MTARCSVCDAPASTLLCHDHRDHLERAIGDLPGLVGDLASSAVRQTSVYRASRRPTRADEDWRGGQHALTTTTLPVNLDASRLLRRAGEVLTAWARHLADRHDIPLALSIGRHLAGPTCEPHVHDFRPADPATGRAAGCGLACDEDGSFSCQRLHCAHDTCRAIRAKLPAGHATALARWLLAHFDVVVNDATVGAAFNELTALHEEMRRAVDRAPSPLYAGPCHAVTTEPITELRDGTIYVQTVTRKCERDLYAWPGQDEIVCNGLRGDEQGCGTVHTAASRHVWLLDSIADALLPLGTWQDALPKLLPTLRWPTRSTWWRWERNNRLEVKGQDRADVDLFRGGDVVELVRTEQRRIIANATKPRRTA